MTEGIRTGLSAEAAVYQVLNDTRARMATITDAYLRERLIDLEDLNQRLLMHLTGTEPGRRDLPEDLDSNCTSSGTRRTCWIMTCSD